MKDVPLVSLMTVHSAKGLEFEAVFLTGMEEDVFPYGGLSGREPEELDEERRLAYVAITRARRRLYITHAQVRTLFGRTELREESRFLCDLPEAVIVREGRRPALSSQKKPWAGGLFGSAHEASFKPGQRIVDRTAFDDEGGLRPGDRVLHKQFGEGIVERIEFGTAPIVVATFREGVKRIHARYLLPA
jgi:DNA helicase-2/ATP-dependent DNA helicase PcrA